MIDDVRGGKTITLTRMTSLEHGPCNSRRIPGALDHNALSEYALLYLESVLDTGVDDWNRTSITALAMRYSAIELHRHNDLYAIPLQAHTSL